MNYVVVVASGIGRLSALGVIHPHGTRCGPGGYIAPTVLIVAVSVNVAGMEGDAMTGWGRLFFFLLFAAICGIAALAISRHRNCAAAGEAMGGDGEHAAYVGCIVVMPDGTMRRPR